MHPQMCQRAHLRVLLKEKSQVGYCSLINYHELDIVLYGRDLYYNVLYFVISHFILILCILLRYMFLYR